MQLWLAVAHPESLGAVRVLAWLLVYAVSCYLLVVTRLSFLEPSVAALKTRLALRPQVRDWTVHILAKSGPDLLLASIMVFRGEDSKAVGKTHGGALSALLLLPGLSRMLLPHERLRRTPLSPRLATSSLGFCLCAGLLTFFISDQVVTGLEALLLLAAFAAVQLLGILMSIARPDPAETEMLVFQQSRALGAVGVLLLPFAGPQLEHGNFDFKFPGHGVLQRVMFATPVGSALEHLAPAAVSIAFFWVFAFSLALDEATSSLAHALGVSDQVVGLTLVAVGHKLPKLISAYVKRHPISVSPDSLDTLTFATSAALALPWLLRGIFAGERSGGERAPALNVAGGAACVAALVVAMATRELPGFKAGACLAGGWLATQTLYWYLSVAN